MPDHDVSNPRMVWILGHMYRLERCDHLHADHKTAARVNWRSHVIQYDPAFSPSARAEGVLHEILEALHYHLELGLEHRQITALSESLYDTLVRNGWLAMRVGEGENG